jgi:hypothetical protein
VKIAKKLGENRGIGYPARRDAGVSVQVLGRAGVARIPGRLVHAFSPLERDLVAYIRAHPVLESLVSIPRSAGNVYSASFTGTNGPR